MKPLIISENKIYSHKHFEEYLTKLCIEHKQEGRALIFAFLIYDFEDSNITKIIQDKEYWLALDSLLGKYMTLFYIDSIETQYEKRMKELLEERSKTYQRLYKIGFHPLLRRIDLKNPKEHLQEILGFDKSLKTPFIIFFQTDDTDIIDYFIVKIRQKRLEDSFLELKDQIASAVAALGEITSENHKNMQEIFDCVKVSVKGHLLRKRVREKIPLNNIIAMVFNLSGKG